MNKNGWTLVHEKTGEPVKIGETLADFRGDKDTFQGGEPPRHEGSKGRVLVGPSKVESEYYPSVFNLKWVKDSV